MTLDRLLTDFVQIWRANTLSATVLSLLHSLSLKGQTKAAAAFKGISAIYGPILFKFGVQIPYQQLCSVYNIVFTLKGQTKAAAAFKGISAIYRQILFKFGKQIA